MTLSGTSRADNAETPEARSIVAPIVLGARLPNSTWDPIEAALQITTLTVPWTTLSDVSIVRDRSTKKNIRKTVAFSRRVLQGRLPDGSYCLRLCDCRSGAEMAEWLGNVQWQISVRKLEDLSVLSGAASGASAILLTVTGFRIYRTSRSIGRSAAEDELLIIPSARQLALTRYCLVQAFAAYDPGLLVVSSGQTNWDDGWWPSVGTSVQMPPTADRIASDIAEPLASEASNSEPHTALCCLDCGASLRLDARYCSECGSEVTVTTSLDGQPTRSDANLKEY